MTHPLRAWIAFFAVAACLAPGTLRAGETAKPTYDYYPEVEVGALSARVDNWRALQLEWNGKPLLAEAGALYAPGYHFPQGGKIGVFPFEELRDSRDIPVRVDDAPGGARVLTWRFRDAEWGVEQINRAVMEANRATFESTLVFTGDAPERVVFHPVFFPSGKTNYKEARTDGLFLNATVVTTDADGAVDRRPYRPQTAETWGGKIRTLAAETARGAVRYTVEVSDPAFSFSVSTGEVWPHYHHVIGAEGLVGTLTMRVDGADKTLRYRITVQLPGSPDTPPDMPEAPEHLYLRSGFGRGLAFFHPGEPVTATFTLPAPFSAAGLVLNAAVRNYRGDLVARETFKSLKAETAWTLAELPVGPYALSVEAERRGKIVGYSAARFGVVPKLAPAPDGKSFFGSFQCYEPFIDEKIALNRYVGVGLVRFRDGRQGEFWRVSEPAKGEWVANGRGVAIANAYRDAGIAMWYTGDQYPPSIVQFSSNDHKVDRPFPAGLTEGEVDFFHYHSRRHRDGFLPKDRSVYRDFVQRYVKQFPMIRRYAVMNEPFPEMDVDMAARVVEWTSEAIRGVYPDAVVQGPGISQLTPGEIQWLDRMLAAGGAKHLSLLAYHHYLGRNWVKLNSRSEFAPVETLGYEEQLRQIAQVAKRHGLPMANAELTWMGCARETWPDARFHASEKNTVDTFVRSYLLEKAAGAQSVTLCFGSTIRTATVDYNVAVERGASFLGMRRMVKPWAVAHAALADLMEGAEFLGRVEKPQEATRLLRFSGRAGAWAALWNYAEVCRASFPFAAGEVELRSVVGAPFVPEDGFFDVGAEPVYLVNRTLAPERFAEGLERLAVRSRGGVGIESISIDPGAHQTLRVAVVNRGDAPARIQRIGYPNANPDITPYRENLDVPPGSGVVELPVRLSVNVPMRIQMELKGVHEGHPFHDRREITMISPTAASAERIGALPIFRAAPRAPEIDADPSDAAWSKAPWIVLDRADQVGCDPGRTPAWGGPADLSARAKLLWDRANLYFLAEVTDDVHHNRQADPATGSWAGDAIQMAFDLNMDSGGGNYNADDHEINVAEWRGQPVMWHRIPFGRAVEGGRMAVTRDGAVTRYELAIPLAALKPWRGESPVGRVIRFNFIVNDDDGKENRRTQWIGLTPGIGETKNPALFRTFLFVDQP